MLGGTTREGSGRKEKGGAWILIKDGVLCFGGVDPFIYLIAKADSRSGFFALRKPVW